MPDRWGFLFFSHHTVGREETFHYPYNMAAYKLLWAMFYAQQDSYAKNKTYLQTKEAFRLTDAELKDLPQGTEISVDATKNLYEITISIPRERVSYTVNNEGRFYMRN